MQKKRNTNHFTPLKLYICPHDTTAYTGFAGSTHVSARWNSTYFSILPYLSQGRRLTPNTLNIGWAAEPLMCHFSGMCHVWKAVKQNRSPSCQSLLCRNLHWKKTWHELFSKLNQPKHGLMGLLPATTEERSCSHPLQNFKSRGEFVRQNVFSIRSHQKILLD